MRTPLWIFILLLPTLGLAQITLSSPSTGTAAKRIMSVEPTHTVRFVGSLDDLQGRLQLTDTQRSAWALYRTSVEAYSTLFFAELPQSAYAAEPATNQVERLAQSTVPRILYISCNPSSWARDGALLVAAGYRLAELRPVGQFRWSTHVELASLFVRD